MVSEAFGEEVKRRRIALIPEVSQGELAEMAGVSRGTIGNIERAAKDDFHYGTKRRVLSALDELEEGRRATTHQTAVASGERGVRESIASQLDALADAYPEFLFPEASDNPEVRAVAAMRHAYRTAARIARGADQ